MEKNTKAHILDCLIRTDVAGLLRAAGESKECAELVKKESLKEIDKLNNNFKIIDCIVPYVFGALMLLCFIAVFVESYKTFIVVSAFATFFGYSLGTITNLGFTYNMQVKNYQRMLSFIDDN